MRACDAWNFWDFSVNPLSGECLMGVFDNIIEGSDKTFKFLFLHRWSALGVNQAIIVLDGV